MAIKVGLVYDLRADYEKMGFSGEKIAEFDSVETIDAIDSTLSSLGYETERVGNIWRLVEELASGKRWDLVFNIAEGLYGMAREAQVPALLDAYQIPYVFSAPDVLVVAHNKALSKQIVAAAGVPTAQYVVVSKIEDVNAVALTYPLFAKPIAEGTGKGISSKSLINAPQELKQVCTKLLAEFEQPVLVETYLSGREFTVGITGTGTDAKAVGVLEVILRAGAESVGHTYNNKENCEELVDYVLATDSAAKQAEQVAINAWRALGCRDGGRIDIRCDWAEVPNFLEVNPLAGLHPTHSDFPILCDRAGVAYKDLIGKIVGSACERLGISEDKRSVALV
jgi:D-alanine-D-alanine ligase